MCTFSHTNRLSKLSKRIEDFVHVPVCLNSKGMEMNQILISMREFKYFPCSYEITSKKLNRKFDEMHVKFNKIC